MYLHQCESDVKSCKTHTQGSAITTGKHAQNLFRGMDLLGSNLDFNLILKFHFTPAELFYFLMAPE